MKRLMTMMMCLVTATALMAQGMIFEPDGTTLEQASVKAKAENKLIFLDCYTSWCGPCKKMAREVFPQEQVGAYMNPKFVNLKINMESEYGAPLAKKLQITAYPTFVIFNADAQEISRFLGGSPADAFIAKVEEHSQDNSSVSLEDRWKKGDRDPQFLREYLKTLTATYKVDDANEVAEAILEGKTETFLDNDELTQIFMRHINNPFCEPFKYAAKNNELLRYKVGDAMADMKIQSVLTNCQRSLVLEYDGTAALDKERYDAFSALLDELGISNANHFRYSTMITLAEKQKDWDAYLKNVRAYIADPDIDADDMQLAKWAKPIGECSDDPKYKGEMKKILQARVDEIKAGKRQAMTKIGNMTLSRPTDELLEMLIGVMDGKMPGGK